MKVSTQSKNYYILYIVALLFGICSVSWLVLRAPRTTAQSAGASVTVAAACSFTGTVNSAHTASIPAGTYKDSIGETVFNAVCNDPYGYSIYAIGYSNNEYGNNKLLATISGVLTPAGDIVTGTATSGNTSNWAMKMIPVTGTSTPVVENGYGDYNVIPATTTKVASFPSATDMTTGSSVKATYAANISSSQPAGNYDGKVKFIMVHPATDTPLESITCDPGKICYTPNARGVADSMSDQSASSNSAVDLWPSNFKRDGYGFAGWNTEFDYSGTTYGPMETITTPDLSTKGLALYAYWIKSAGDLQGWQGCDSLASGAVTALTDTRDNNTYAVAKLADGNCWMIENLRLGGSSAMNLTTANTVTAFTLPASTNTFDTSDYTAIQMSAKNTLEAPTNMTTSTNAEVYSYGNYYSWAAVIGSTTAYSTDNQSVNTSICPSGWHLPKGGDSNNATNSEFWKLGTAIMGFAPSNNFSYQNTETNTAGKTATAAIRSYPNNFLYSGYLNGSSFNTRGSDGNYWSSTVRGSNYSYYPYFYSSLVAPGTYNGDKYLGFSVRCVAGSPIYTIRYHGNNSDTGTTMSVTNTLEVDQSTTLMPSNYKRAGYGFAGWNTKPDGTGENFGPMETVTLSTSDTKGNALLQAANGKEITLYAKWVPSAGNIQGWTGCSSLAQGAVTALKDTRDNNVYAVSKLADGKCWMIENLRLGGSSAMNLTTANTVTAFTLPASTNTFTTSNYTTIEMSAKNTLEASADMTATNAEVYSYGNYYSWPAAIGSTTAYSSSNQSVSTSICPSGWHLPKGGQNTVASGQSGDFYVLTTTLMGGEAPNNPNSGYAYYQGTVNGVDVGAKASSLLRTYPNNIIYSGGLNGSSFNTRGSYGYYWSSTVGGSNHSYNLGLASTRVTPGTNGRDKYNGFSVRCVAGS
ncbi:InlB B-repeat-containing protein [Candidatus Saccharibacteria bacterium]|nr:InlB B-repeat-containing protein [Candidatus Saccharibacteria bacterium]